MLHICIYIVHAAKIIPGPVKEYEAKIYVARPKESVVRGQTAFLECIPYGYPTSTIVWAKVSNSSLSFLSVSFPFLSVVCFSCWLWL